MIRRALPLVILLLVGLLCGLLLMRPTPPGAYAVRTMPALALTALDRSRLILPMQGEPAIVNVFASWCVPCAAEMPLLEKLAETGIAIYGIAYKDEPKNLAAYLRRYGNPFKAIAMDDGSAAAQLGITGVPESYLVDGQGVIRRHAEGMLDDAQVQDWQQEIASWR